MTDIILNTFGLVKQYGRITAVDSLDLSVCRGEVHGILGPNGSGKTTTLGILLGVIKQGNGSFTWFDSEPSALNRRRIGSTLEMPLFYPYLNGVDNLKIVSDIRGCGYDAIDPVLKRVGLYDRRTSRFKTYSLGMKQRLAIAAALLGNPEVLIFDEPTNGLDPQGIAEIRQLIISIAHEGKTIIMASHLLDEVQKTCSHVTVLSKGKRLYSGKVSEFIRNDLTVEVGCDNLDSMNHEVSAWPGYDHHEISGGMVLIKLKEGYNPGMLNAFAFSKHIVIQHLSIRNGSLEKHFLELLNENHEINH
ncbi:MAG: ATP-binding cassette domain-containing protein [Bacteroidales bacterium]|nr:ATP-binding cassette domain-containing protein [Bacteroidales bacterium]